MNIARYIIIILQAFLIFTGAKAQDSVAFKGQLSAYTHVNSSNTFPWMSGIRYIPQLNLGRRWNDKNLIDLEASANLFANAGVRPFSESDLSGRIKPYRLWSRYSTSQFELRAGLQKINFGSASLLRPLMWFDQIDPRDPLKLTDGVWALLARYYFLNNTNIWLWGLYGNENRKGWETIGSKSNIPEYGGRIQFPMPQGEAGFSFHHRVADGSTVADQLAAPDRIPENRFGFDAKFDMVIGWWIEASLSYYDAAIGGVSAQETINAGADYTFGLGNGLTVIYEQLLASAGRKPFECRKVTTFSLLNLSYPFSMADNLNAIIYYDWTNNRAYNFLTWQKQLNRLSLYFIGYINPETYYIPAQGTGENLFAGTGIQIMLVLNH